MLDNHTLARLRAIGFAPWVEAHLQNHPGPEEAPFLRRVVAAFRETIALHDGERECSAQPMPRLQHEGPPPVVGDWVWASCNRHGQWWVHERLPPRVQLARSVNDGRDKTERASLVNNVDTALLVMGLDGDFNLRRLERYLALVRLAGVQPVVVLTKADRCDPLWVERRLAEACAHLPAGADAVALDARGAEPRAALAPWLQPGQTLVLLGSSGAGKSTLTNALLGRDLQATGATRDGDGRGRHTTTSRHLRPLPDGACVIDTPGLRTLRLEAEPRQLLQVFDDIARWAERCRFRDCRHAVEPGCAVREHVDASRVAGFHKLQREARRDRISALERREQQRQWKVRARAHRAGERARDAG